MPEGLLIRRLDAIKSPPSPMKQSIPKPLVLACFWLLFARAKSNPGVGRGGPQKLKKEKFDFISYIFI